jgi:hypothetical protein
VLLEELVVGSLTPVVEPEVEPDVLLVELVVGSLTPVVEPPEVEPPVVLLEELVVGSLTPVVEPEVEPDVLLVELVLGSLEPVVLLLELALVELLLVELVLGSLEPVVLLLELALVELEVLLEDEVESSPQLPAVGLPQEVWTTGWKCTSGAVSTKLCEQSMLSVASVMPHSSRRMPP